MSIISTALMIVQMLSAIVLIVLVISQTTKSEGLSGTIGGKMSSSFRGKPGIDEKLAGITRWSAILFMGTSLAVYILRARMGA